MYPNKYQRNIIELYQRILMYWPKTCPKQTNIRIYRTYEDKKYQSNGCLQTLKPFTPNNCTKSQQGNVLKQVIKDNSGSKKQLMYNICKQLHTHSLSR